MGPFELLGWLGVLAQRPQVLSTGKMLERDHNRRAGAVTGITRQATFQPEAPR
jgi:hypothetical protein